MTSQVINVYPDYKTCLLYRYIPELVIIQLYTLKLKYPVIFSLQNLAGQPSLRDHSNMICLIYFPCPFFWFCVKFYEPLTFFRYPQHVRTCLQVAKLLIARIRIICFFLSLSVTLIKFQSHQTWVFPQHFFPLIQLD